MVARGGWRFRFDKSREGSSGIRTGFVNRFFGDFVVRRVNCSSNDSVEGNVARFNFVNGLLNDGLIEEII